MFVAVGLLGVVLIVGTLLFDDVVEGLVPGSDLFSGPALGAVLGAFGITGWVLQSGFGTPAGVAALGGLGAGLGLGYVTARTVRALVHAPTDATPRALDLVGRPARVVTGIRPGGVGEVLVTLGGQPVKLTAALSPAASECGPAQRPDGAAGGGPAGHDEVPTGTEVTIIAVESSTKVVVQTSDEFWT